MTWFILSLIAILFWSGSDLFSKLAAALCETAGQFAYVFAIGANAIVAAPMISSYCIMSLVWSRIFLKEKLSKAQYAVIAVAAVGIAILGME